jgi:hypothetical protein
VHGNKSYLVAVHIIAIHVEMCQVLIVTCGAFPFSAVFAPPPHTPGIFLLVWLAPPAKPAKISCILACFAGQNAGKRENGKALAI